MSNKFAVWGLIAVALILAIGYYFFFILKPAINDPIQLVPENAVVVMQLDNPGDFYTKLATDNEIWESLKKGKATATILDQLVLIDSIVQHEKSFSGIKTGQSIISVHFDTTFNETQVLFTVELKSNNPDQIIQDLQQHFKISTSEHYQDVYAISNDEIGLSLFAGFSNKILLVSKQDWLINNVLQSQDDKKTHFSRSKEFVKLRNTAGKNTDARIFINFKCLSKFLKNSLDNSSKHLLDGFENFAGWSETDLLIKNDELLFSGFTFSHRDSYLGMFSAQKPGRIESFKLAPFNTSLLFATIFSDINATIDLNALSRLSKSLNFDLSKFLAVCGNELTSVCNASDKNMVKSNSWLFLALEDAGKAKQYLNLMSSNTGVKKGTTRGRYTIREIKRKGLIPDLFGKPYAIIQNTWYTFIGDYVVFANTPGSLNQLISNYESGKTLDLNENFKLFTDNITANSNVFLYISPRHITGFLNQYLNSNTLRKINQNQAVLNDFQGLSFQFASRDSVFYTNFYVRNDKSALKENLDLWRIELDNEISGTPYLVKDHSSNTYNIIVFDIEANIYLISADGQILWKKKLDNIPESGIQQMDYYNNGKIQYLFNTRDFMYLLDKNGTRVENYPKKINPSATNGLSLFDYDNNKTYRILLAQADKRTYNYTEAGKRVEGWLKPRTDNIVTEPIVHLNADGLDYIIITDINNNLNIVNRRGKQRIKLSKKLDKARNSTYYINQTNSKGIILTTDKYGRLTYLSKTGKIQHTEFGEYSADHFFLYEDFTGNGSRDFIYIEGNQLNVFNRFKKVLFNYKFPAEISIKPVFFKLGRKQTVLGVVDKQNKTIYLFDKDGNPIINSGLVGENAFTVGSLYNDGEINLVTSVGKTLYNYRLN